MIEEPREFIRHPSSIPIHFKLGHEQTTSSAKDVGSGGLCFRSTQSVSVGSQIQVEITSCDPVFKAEGIVRWCRPEGRNFLIGIAFTDEAVRFAVRMVEQVCYIEDYRQQIEAETGRRISSHQAALSWIESNAETFPKTD